MWLLPLPLPAERRLALPPGQHCFPWYYDAIEIGRLAEFLAGILKDVERHWILPWSVARALFSTDTPPNLHSTLAVITFSDAHVDSETLDEFLAHPHFRHVLLHFPQPRETGYAWQEKYLKRALIDLIREEISRETHPLASMQVTHLPVLRAATLTTDALGLVDLLEATLLHRMEHAAEGTGPEHYKASLDEVAGRRFAARLLRLLPEDRDAAIDLLKKEGAGVWQDEPFRLGARALQEIGLARVGEGSVTLGPLARRANEAWLFPILHQLSSRSASRRWVAETALAVEQAPEEWADFARASLSTLTSLLTVFRAAPQSNVGPLDTLERVRDWIRAGSTFRERCARARDFLTDPERERFVRAKESDDYALWWEPILGALTEEELTRIRLDLVPSEPQFQVLDGNRFHWMVTEQHFDAFLGRCPDAKVDLAHWMAFALFDNAFVDRKDLFADFLAWLWRAILSDQANAGLQDEGLGSVRRCLALARKNNYVRKITIEQDAMALGIDVDDVLPAGERTSEFILTMKGAFENMLDGAFVEARDGYAKAAAMAHYANDPFGEWVALRGKYDAEKNRHTTSIPETLETRAALNELRYDANRLMQSPQVDAWIRRVEKLHPLLIQNYLDHARTNRQVRMSGGVAHDYFVMFRDLETIYASPDLQRKYIRPLLDARARPVIDEFMYRLRLDIEKPESTTVWLRRLLDERYRIDGFLPEFMRSGIFRRERLHRLCILPTMIHLFHVENLPWLRDFLSTCRSDVDVDGWSYARYTTEYVEALCAHIKADTSLAAIEYFLNFGPNSISWSDRRTLAAHLNAVVIPIGAWLGVHNGLTERITTYVFDHLRQFQTQPGGMSRDELLMPTLLRVLLAARRFDRAISPQIIEEARSWANQYIGHDDAIRIAHLLASNEQARDELRERVLAALPNAMQDAANPSIHGIPFRMWIELVDANESPTSSGLAAAAQRLWELLALTWQSVINSGRLNAVNIESEVRFLLQWLASGLSTNPPAVRQKLLELLALAPQHLTHCHEILDSNLWQNDWPAFVSLIRKHAGGDHSDSTAAKMGALDLLEQWANHFQAHTPLPDDLSFLVDAALWAIRDENHLVANHAAYAIAAYAMHAQTPTDIHRVSDGLRRLAVDPRVEVRGAAGYAGKRLPLVAGIHDDIRAVAREVDERLATDTYAIVARQRIFGELDGKYPPLPISRVSP